MSVTFYIAFAVMAFAAVGLGELYLFLIREGQLFDFMQKPLLYLSKKKSKWAEFGYKSIGGCKVCTIQRFADMTFALLIILNPMPWYLAFVFYCLFGGLVFYAQSIKQEQINPIVKSQKLDI